MEKEASSHSELENCGRTLVHSARENFGENLSEGGIIVRPSTEGIGDITVRIATHDTGRAHNTQAVVDVSKQNRVARLAISAVEPTIGAKHTPVQIESTTSVEMDGAADAIESAQTLREVGTALDKGEFEAYARV